MIGVHGETELFAIDYHFMLIQTINFKRKVQEDLENNSYMNEILRLMKCLSCRSLTFNL